MSSQSHRRRHGPSRRRESSPPPDIADPNLSNPGYSGSSYHYTTQGAPGTTQPTASGSPLANEPESFYPQAPSSALEQSSGPPTWRQPLYPSSVPNPFGGSISHYPVARNLYGGSHSHQSANAPSRIGFIQDPDPGPYIAASSPSLGVQSTSRGHPTGPNKRRALVIGTNYYMHPDHSFRLQHGIEDAYGMANFLYSNLGFARRDIRLITDDEWNLPMKNTILVAMRALVADAQPGDSFFFYFSGHSTQIRDLDGDEMDGQDECICAMDYRADNDPYATGNTPGLIVDDEMHEIMVKYLPRGCRLTALFDSFHSGSALKLPYIYDSNGVVRPVIHRDRLRFLQQRASHADVVCLSASKDGRGAFEASLRRAFIECVGSSGGALTYRGLLRGVRDYMTTHHLQQRPRLSTSYEIDTNTPFIT